MITLRLRRWSLALTILSAVLWLASVVLATSWRDPLLVAPAVLWTANAIFQVAQYRKLRHVR